MRITWSMFKRIAFAAAVAAAVITPAAVAVLVADNGPTPYDERGLPELADIDFANVDAVRVEVGDDTEIVNDAISWMWENGDALCDLAVSGINWRDIVRALYAADRISSDEEIAWARGYVSGCENRAYLDQMADA